MSVAIIPDFVKYQIEWLTSHNDLEFEPVIEDAIIQMLKDTGKSFIDEQAVEISQIDHVAGISKKVSISCGQENDLISRQVAIEELRGRDPSQVWDIADIEVWMNALPSAQPKPNQNTHSEQRKSDKFVAKTGKTCADTISRQAAIEALRECQTYLFDPHDPDKKISLESAELAIEDLPSAQPEIIRCKDCDWWTKQEDSVQGRCELMQMYPAGGWYCGNARRRQE